MTQVRDMAQQQEIGEKSAEFDQKSYLKMLVQFNRCQLILLHLLKVPQFKLLNIIEQITGEIY